MLNLQPNVAIVSTCRSLWLTSRRELAAVVTRRYPESPHVTLINANSMNNYNTRKMNIITLDDFCSGHGLTGRSASTIPDVLEQLLSHSSQSLQKCPQLGAVMQLSGDSHVAFQTH